MTKMTLMHAGPSQMLLPTLVPFLCAVKLWWGDFGTFRTVIWKEESVPKMYCCQQSYFQDFQREAGATFPYQIAWGGHKALSYDWLCDAPWCAPWWFTRVGHLTFLTGYFKGYGWKQALHSSDGRLHRAAWEISHFPLIPISKYWL